jgi:Mrp family chromosome partitioning ATPase
VAFVSANREEGVTRTVRGLSSELVLSGKTVVTLDGALHASPAPDMRRAEETLRIEPSILGAPRLPASETASTFVTSLRERYSCILLDCGSLESSTDLLRLAPLSDGVVLVVEAGRTGKDQIDRAARVIREAEGTLLGCVLNKRRYPVPDWLYRLL